MKVFEPSFYTATFVFVSSIVALIIIFSAVMATAPGTRESMGVFTVIVALGGLYIGGLAFWRIRQAERAHTRQAETVGDNHRMLGCPDTHVSDGNECVYKRRNLTLDGALVEGASSTLTHAAQDAQAFDVQQAREMTKANFLLTACSDDAWNAEPWAAHKALCPIADS